MAAALPQAVVHTLVNRRQEKPGRQVQLSCGCCTWQAKAAHHGVYYTTHDEQHQGATHAQALAPLAPAALFLRAMAGVVPAVQNHACSTTTLAPGALGGRPLPFQRTSSTQPLCTSLALMAAR